MTGNIVPTIFIAIRLGMVCLLNPIQAIQKFPMRLKITALLMSSFLINQFLPFRAPSDLVSGIAAECTNGLLLALPIYLVFATFHIAGQLIDTHMGLNTLAILNPAEHQHEMLNSRFLTMLAVILFFEYNLHHTLLYALLTSFKKIPPGQWMILHHPDAVLLQASALFRNAFMIAAPILTTLLLLDLASSILTRNMPQVSPYFLMLPIKILLGLLLLFWLIPVLAPVLRQQLGSIFYTWDRVML